MKDERLEFDLLFQLDDDWITLWELMYYTIKASGPDTSAEQAADVIRFFAESGLITLGALAQNDIGWEAWDVDLGEAMRRIEKLCGTQRSSVRASPRRVSGASRNSRRASTNDSH